jgi:ATP-dependent DNA helicase RecQ
MWPAARESGGEPNVTFRRRILDYLSEGDISPALERLVDAPHFVYADWQQELSRILGSDEARELRGNTARLLASYPDHPGMLLARGFSELADDRGDLKEVVSSLDASLASAVTRYGTSQLELEALVEWLLSECDRRRQPLARTAVVAVAEGSNAAEGAVTRALGEALDDASEADPGLLVLALANALNRTLADIDALLSQREGVVA